MKVLYTPINIGSEIYEAVTHQIDNKVYLKIKEYWIKRLYYGCEIDESSAIKYDAVDVCGNIFSVESITIGNGNGKYRTSKNKQYFIVTIGDRLDFENILYEKQCPICGRFLPLSSFHSNVSCRDKVSTYCKDCCANANRKNKSHPVVDLPYEVWCDVVGYEGLYMVSNKGRIKSHTRMVDYPDGTKRLAYGKLIKRNIDSQTGYPRVHLSKNGISTTYNVHRIVAEAFIPNPLQFPIINHKDEDKTNNRADNLEWCTQEYNVNYGSRRAIVNRQCPVRQRDKDGNIIAEYSSMVEASKATGIPKQTIHAACDGRYGNKIYKWERI